jgi:hypothetical protein
MSWGGAALSPPPAAPFSGEIDSDTAGTTTIVDLGLGCLYIGGGGATSVPPSRVVDGSTSVFGVAGTGAIVPLVASGGNGPADCTLGPHRPVRRASAARAATDQARPARKSAAWGQLSTARRPRAASSRRGPST